MSNTERTIATERIKRLVKEHDNASKDERDSILDEITAITVSLSKLAYTDGELCAMLGVSTATTYRWRRDKIIDYCYLTAKQVGYLPEHITNFLRSRVIKRDERRSA